MRIVLFFFCTFIATSAHAEETPPAHVSIKGKFQFQMRNSDNELLLGNFINSTSEIISASTCSLKISADDDYYNTYPMELNLYKVNSEVVPFIQAKSMYIDENSRYWNKTIKRVSFSVANLIADEKTWKQETIDCMLRPEPITHFGIIRS